MSYLFQVSLGPVQSFIVGARRTRDLKFGSLFLSELAEAVVNVLVGQYGRESLIFPALDETFHPYALLEDVPNKILAYLDGASETDITTLATVLKSAIDKHIDGITGEVFQYITKKLSPSQAEKQWPSLSAHRESLLKEMREHFSERVGNEGVAIRQIHDLVEYNWAAIPYQEKNADYAIRRQQLEALLAARKNTRDFAPVTWGEELTQRAPHGAPKSSIDGMYESVVPEAAYPRPLNTRNAQGLEDRKKDYLRKVRILRDAFGAGPHEKLSAIDLLKRLGPMSDSDDNFPSTSHVAALPFLHGLLKLDTPKHVQAAGGLDAYIQELLAIKEILPAFTPDLLPKKYRHQPLKEDMFFLGKYDGSLLYPERFPDMVGDTQEFELAREQFQAATRTLDNLLKEIGLHPQPYYAILVADGDSMGKIIDALARQSNGLQQHKTLSLALSHMAPNVRSILIKHTGIRIYSGGDDILAILPLHTAIQCVSELATQFRDNLQGFSNDEGKAPTLSGGLAIVHHLHPLGDALRIAREAEKRAKKGEKNALAITLQKRSGPPCEIGGVWQSFDTRLEQLIKLCEEIIPSGMAYELRELALRLNPDPEQKKGADSASEQKAMPAGSQEKASTSPDYIQYAALRVLERKMGETSAARQDKKAAALALYALKCMIGLIGATGEKPEEALKTLYKTFDPLAKNPQLLIELKQKVGPMNELQPVRVEDLANELVVARFFADARRLANGGVAPEGAEL
jgi:CRISPR-associated protein Cmr2